MNDRFLSISNWLIKNLGLLILALILGLVIWFTAQYTNDPNVIQTTRPIKLQLFGKDPEFIIIDEEPQDVQVTLQAPRSIWNQINDNPELLQPFVDLSELGPGVHTLEVNPNIDQNLNPIRLVSIDPQVVQIELEQLVTKQFPIDARINGKPQLGYEQGELTVNPENVTISGPLSNVNRVKSVQINYDISGVRETQNVSLPIAVLDENGNSIDDISISPDETTINLPISLLGGFKNVVVKVDTSGQIAEGYRLTNVSVSPPTITVFSEDPRILDSIPGFVETLPVDLTNLSDDSETSQGLKLPEGVTAVRNPEVLVQLSIAAIESSETFSVPILITGLSPEFDAALAPELVDVIVAGPINILESFTTDGAKAFIDLEGLPAGSIYQLAPAVELNQDQLRVQTTIPETVEVQIFLAPTPTPEITSSPTPAP